jgi:hypothetical protein
MMQGAQQPRAMRQPRRRKRPGIAAILILDQGLRVYRRHFLTFLLVALGWLVPMVLLIVTTLPEDLFDGFLFRRGPRPGIWTGGTLFLTQAVLYAPPLLILSNPLAGLAATLLDLGMIFALSGVIVDFEGERGPTWRRMWRVSPARVAGGMITSLCYMIVVAIALVATICICGVMGQVLGAIFSSSFGYGSIAYAGALIVGVSTILALLTTAAATIIGLCYVQQALIQSQDPLWPSAFAGLGALFRHLGQNLRLLLSGGLVLAAVWGALTSWIFAALLLVSVFTELEESALIATSATLGLSWLLAFPLAPIWAAIAYRRQNDAARHVTDLEGRIRKFLVPSS